MLSPQELQALLGHEALDETDVSNDNNSSNDAEDERAAFDIILATDALIYVLDRGSHLENRGLRLRPLRQELERLRLALSDE